MDTKEITKFPYQELLTSAGEYLFLDVMRNRDICMEILQRTINVKLKDVDVVDPQKPLDIAFHRKSIFLTMHEDGEEEDSYNIELHYADVDDILMQSRFISR